MKKYILLLFTFLPFFLLQHGIANAAAYGQGLCRQGVPCVTVEDGDTWDSLWPDPTEREEAMRINRVGGYLHAGMRLAVPDTLSQKTRAGLVPFAQNMGPQNNRTILVSPGRLAWAAYDTDGSLVRWGVASTGRDFCADTNSHCKTPRGAFMIYRKEGADCISTKFPLRRGGAPMPYCMFFKGGFAIHGSYDLPGYNASHGCVRVPVEDARWLNQEFITLGETRVIVRD
jgi:L,D-transpeptidase ErfK/SrfK